MIMGIPKEIKSEENRVAIVPSDEESLRCESKEISPFAGEMDIAYSI